MASNAFGIRWTAATSAAGSVVLSAFAALPARAADEAVNYPARPIRIVVPYQPGDCRTLQRV